MGRLFWKFFLLVCLVQAIAVMVVGVSMTWRHHHRCPDDVSLLCDDDGPGGPPPPPDAGAGPRDFAPPPPPPSAQGPLGLHHHGPGHHREGWAALIPPPEPIIGGLIASVVSATLLAWYLSKPIRTLSDAFEAAAEGHLQVRVAGRMGSRKDELADLGRDFDQMVERLQALIVGQRQLLHDVSHEMRSPLARIQAAIGLAGQRSDQSADALQRIERESMRMDKLIGELLAIARLQAGFTGAMDEEIDLRELLDAIVDDASFEARAKGRSVVLEAQADALVRGNVELLRRAIENVVRNAIKYGGEGSTVRVASERTPGGRVRVRVCDAGPGVPERDLEAIFEPFFRSSGGQDGHGLGLAIARRVVEAHRGTILAHNLPAGGLCIQMELPVAA